MRRSLASAFVLIVACVLGASPPSASADPAVTSATGQVSNLSCQSGVLLFNPSFHAKRDDQAGPTSASVVAYDQEVRSHVDDPGGPSVSGAGNINEPNVIIGPMSSDSSVGQRTTVSSGPDSVVVDSSATATARKTHVVDNCCFSTVASASTTFRIDVVVARRCRYQINGYVSGASDAGGSASASLHLTGPGPDPDLFVGVPGEKGKPTASSIARSGVFDPGPVALELTVTSDLGGIGQTSFRTSTGTDALASWNVSFSISPEEPGDDIRWTKSAGGTFGADANWDPQQVPVKDATHVDRAIFDLRGRYAVEFAAASSAVKALGLPRTSDRLLIDRGDVTFENANYKVDNPSVETPSLVVDTGKLTLASGQLTSNSATIGDLHGVGAEIDVVGADSRWDCLGRLRVGGSDGSPGSGGDAKLKILGGAAVTSAESRVGAGGAANDETTRAGAGDGQYGSVTVDGAGTSWTTGNIAVGYSSGAGIVVTGGAKVASDLIYLGLLGGDDLVPTIGVSGADANGTATEWDATTLRIGPAFSILALTDGGTMKVSGAFVDHGAVLMGRIDRVHGAAPFFGCNSLTVGDGSFQVADGGQAFVVGGETTVGFGAAAGPGILVVDGNDPTTGAPSSFDTDGLLSVGAADQGAGDLQLTGGAKLTCGDDVNVGAQGRSVGVAVVSGGSTWKVTGNMFVGDAGTGLVSLNSSTLDVVGDVVVAPTGTLQGDGTLVVGGTLLANGFVDPRIDVVPAIAPLTPRRAGAPRKTPAPPPVGTLTIQGNLVVGPTGTIRAEAAGARSDRLVVAGDATLDGALVLQFKNGFAPKTGDQFELFHVNGSTTGAFASVETRGLAAGAQFDVATTDGAFTVTATNDAVALPTVGVKASTKRLFEKRSKKKATLTFSRKGPTTAPLVVSYALRGTADNGFDCVSLPGTVTIPAKKRSAKVVVQVVNDAAHELAETIDVAVLPGEDYTQSLKSNARITIVDDD